MEEVDAHVRAMLAPATHEALTDPMSTDATSLFHFNQLFISFLAMCLLCLCSVGSFLLFLPMQNDSTLGAESGSVGRDIVAAAAAAMSVVCWRCSVAGAATYTIQRHHGGGC